MGTGSRWPQRGFKGGFFCWVPDGAPNSQGNPGEPPRLRLPVNELFGRASTVDRVAGSEAPWLVGSGSCAGRGGQRGSGSRCRTLGDRPLQRGFGSSGGEPMESSLESCNLRPCGMNSAIDRRSATRNDRANWRFRLCQRPDQPADEKPRDDDQSDRKDRSQPIVRMQRSVHRFRPPRRRLSG
jgi:hypothetical protein